MHAWGACSAGFSAPGESVPTCRTRSKGWGEGWQARDVGKDDAHARAHLEHVVLLAARDELDLVALAQLAVDDAEEDDDAAVGVVVPAHAMHVPHA